MTPGDKELLLKDLCARLPYGVKIQVNNKIEILEGIGVPDNIVEYGSFLACEVEEVKPYLFPLSSMTEGQRREYTKAQGDDGDIVFLCAKEYVEKGADLVSAEYHATDWLNVYHFDYRGLIPKGLAIDATGLNIY